MSNPFMGTAAETTAAPTERLDLDPVLGSALAARGPQVPPLSLPAGVAGVDVETVDGATQPWLWLLSLHGGSGATTVASLFPVLDSVRERTTWPRPQPDGFRSRVLLITRTHGRGLARLTMAAAQWAGGTFPALDLVGTVLVADGPRPSKAQREQIRRATSLTPATWHLGWQESWRACTPEQVRSQPLRVRLTISAIIRRTAALSDAVPSPPVAAAVTADHLSSPGTPGDPHPSTTSAVEVG